MSRVEDIEAPDFEVDATFARNTSTTDCYYTARNGEFDPFNISDNCTSEHFTITNDKNNYKSLDYVQFPIGTTTVEWSVKGLLWKTKK